MASNNRLYDVDILASQVLKSLEMFRIRLRKVQRIQTITTLFGLLTKKEKTSCILYFVLEEVREKIKEWLDLPSVIAPLTTANTMLKAAETLLINPLSTPVNPVHERITEDLKEMSSNLREALLDLKTRVINSWFAVV